MLVSEGVNYTLLHVIRLVVPVGCANRFRLSLVAAHLRLGRRRDGALDDDTQRAADVAAFAEAAQVLDTHAHLGCYWLLHLRIARQHRGGHPQRGVLSQVHEEELILDGMVVAGAE